MNKTLNRQWCVGDAGESENHPQLRGLSLTREHFLFSEDTVPEIREGELLIRAVYFSPDPMNHAWVRGMPGKFDPIPVGDVMRGGIAGRVVESKNPAWQVGEGVTGFLDWADYSVSDGTDHLGVPLQRVPPGLDLASGLTALGMTGLCAYLGISEIGKPSPGDTVLVSGASGGIGSLAGQVARLAGSYVVGIAGGAAKCEMVRNLGFDDVVDYRAPDFQDSLATACPRGIDVFFDNVGGSLLDAALVNMAHGGHIVICGGTAHYAENPPGIFNHIQLAMRAVTMSGFFYFDHLAEWPKGRDRLAGWLRDGLIREALDIEEGFDAVPQAALSQFQGGVTGRKLIRIADDPNN